MNTCSGITYARGDDLEKRYGCWDANALCLRVLSTRHWRVNLKALST